MGSKIRKAFTVAELAIGVLLILIIGGPVVMTLRSGIELYTKTEANAEVTNGVRFTVDSFNRRISPMLDHTSEIMVLLDPTIPDPVPKNDNYLFLLNNRVVHRDISGDHFLEGSEHISGLTFTVPSSADLSPDNYLLEIALNGSYKTARLDVEAKQALYNLPVKDGNNIVSDNYVGNVIYFKTPGAHDMSISFDVYDNATKIKINNSLMPKGTVILASYDLNITRNGIEVSFTDESSLDWYISDSTSSPTIIATDISARGTRQFLLVDDDNKPITVNTLNTAGDTSGDFYVRTGTDTKTSWGPYGVIRARLRPAATTSRGKKLTGESVWSDYVQIGYKTFWEEWLDAIAKKKTNEEFSITSLADTQQIQLTAVDNKISVRIQSNRFKEDATSVTVARLDYKFMYNDILYSIWKNREDQTSDKIPTIMTMTNYSVMIDSEIEDIYFYGIILSDTPKNDFLQDNSGVFEDIGYEFKFQLKPDKKSDISGLIMDKYAGAGGTGTYNGITNITTAGDNYYHPEHIQNDRFIYDGTEEWWQGRHRILVTILEYYVDNQTDPKYIFRVRILKNLSEFSDAERAVIKTRDPWFIGPDFYASEPIWFGDFVGSSLANGTTVDVRRYDESDPETTISLSSARTDGADKKFYGLKIGENSNIFKAKVMNIKDNITDTAVKNILSDPKRDRFLGLRVYNHPSNTNPANAFFYEIDIVPGFTADEIRSILPTGGKLYEINETVDIDNLEASNRLLITSQPWYTDSETHATDYNDALFGTDGYSDGSGNNGSRYSTTAPGILGLQHVPDTCTCPLDNEVFKWIK